MQGGSALAVGMCGAEAERESRSASASLGPLFLSQEGPARRKSGRHINNRVLLSAVVLLTVACCKGFCFEMGSVKRDRKSLECERRAGGKQILILRYHAGSSMHGPSDDPENKCIREDTNKN